jgi:ADP-ribose pyrophosphatase YjhB (NUDIX family)
VIESFAAPRVAAGVLFLDAGGRVLCVRPTYKPGWDLPGGYLRPDETPTVAAAREVAEELGIEPPIGRLLVADWAPNPGEGDKLLFVFDGGMLAAAHRDRVAPDPGEIAAVAYHDPGTLADLMIPRLARRVTAALAARAAGVTRYLEHGAPPPTGPGN